jgi:5-(carboxyamino)imidazole ribonucleotide synthase
MTAPLSRGREAPVLPGATVGILGGGQLGRMLAIAARRLGYGVCVWAPERGSPAFALADEVVCAAYDDAAARERFAATVDVVTLEFENLPADMVAALAEAVPVRPGPGVLRIAQHRGREKRFLSEQGLAVVPYEEVTDAADLARALDRIGTPAVLKTSGFGYDGKGQVAIDGADGSGAGVELLAGGPCLLELRVELAAELSVVVARGLHGDVVTFPVCENAHANHVLDVTVMPARVERPVTDAADGMAREVAEALDLVGLACVEFFLTTDGDLLVNEIAPRPHNSGHLTLEACHTDQFEQQLRAVCGLPLGDPTLRSPGAMANLLGDLWGDGAPDWAAALARPGVHLHLYGKATARRGRKMGHLSVLDPDPDAAERRVREARAAVVRRSTP